MIVDIEVTNLEIVPELNAVNLTIKPTFTSGSTVKKTSELENDGADGEHPFITAEDIPGIDLSEYQKIEDPTLETTAQTIAAAINEVRTIALGADIAFVFDTFAAMEAWLLIPENVALLEIGNLFLIRELTVPDYWWDGIEALELEVKIDLTNYYTKSEIETLFPNETASTIGALIETTELETITDTTKIAASVEGVVNWFSGLRIKEFLSGYFAKLSGGNTFSGTQVFNDDVKIAKTTGEVLKLGENSGTGSTATPLSINMGATFSNTAGQKPKVALYKDATLTLGFGFSLNEFDYIAHAPAKHAFWSGTVRDIEILPYAGGIRIADAGGVLFSQSTSDTTATIGIKRLDNDTIQIYDGVTSGQYRDLKLRKTIQTGILEYADNAAALAGGLTAGMQYRTGDLLKIVH